MFKQVDIISTPFDLVANGIRVTPSGAGKKRQCRVSILSFGICLTRNIDQLLWFFFGTSLDLRQSAMGKRSTDKQFEFQRYPPNILERASYGQV